MPTQSRLLTNDVGVDDDIVHESMGEITSNSEEYGALVLCEELQRLNEMSTRNGLGHDHSWIGYLIKQKHMIRKFQTFDHLTRVNF